MDINEVTVQDLYNLGACDGACQWLVDQSSLQEGWNKCGRFDWMIWVIGRFFNKRVAKLVKEVTSKLVEELTTIEFGRPWYITNYFLDKDSKSHDMILSSFVTISNQYVKYFSVLGWTEKVRNALPDINIFTVNYECRKMIENRRKKELKNRRSYEEVFCSRPQDIQN